MIKKNQGFTILEVLIVVGIISVLLISAYGVIAKKQDALLVEKQAKYVNQIIGSLNDYFIDISPDPSIGTPQLTGILNPPTQLIEQRLIPSEMINTNNSLQTLWKTNAAINPISIDITPSDGLANSVTGYEISLMDVPGKACSLLASQTYIINKAQRITINGNTVRYPGVSEPEPSLIATYCNDLNNTINIATDVYKRGIESIVSSNAGALTRNKENKYYIAPTGQSTSSTAPACSGSSSWDPITSACICPSNAKWDGNSCASINNNSQGQAGNCAIGLFWNQTSRACQPICPLNEVYNPISNSCVPATNEAKTLCIPGISESICETVNNKVAATSVYEAGRHIPSTIKNPIVPAFEGIDTDTNHTAQIVTSMPLNNINGGSNACPPGAKPVLAMNAINSNGGTAAEPIANYDGKVCQMCINGSWDGDRCVAK